MEPVTTRIMVTMIMTMQMMTMTKAVIMREVKAKSGGPAAEYGGPYTAYDFPIRDEQVVAQVKQLTCSYGLNLWVYHAAGNAFSIQGRPVEWNWRRFDVPEPTVTPLFLDAMWRGAGPHHTDKPPAYNGRWLGYDGGGSEMHHVAIQRHGKGVNVVFFDDSVRRVKTRELWSLQWHRKYDRAHHLGSGVTHVTMLGEFVRQKLDQPAEAELLAGRLVQSARELARTMDEVVWTTDPAKDTLRSFASYITNYAESFLAGSSLRLRLNFPRETPDFYLPSELRHNLFMVLKEALNNVAKHAHASEVKIRLEMRDHTLHLVIEDDGRGFAKGQQPSNRNGLANMETRLRELEGELQIESVLGRGTRVEANVSVATQPAVIVQVNAKWTQRAGAATPERGL